VAGSSDEDIGRYVYQLKMSGWASFPTFFGGFASPWGSSFVGELGALMCSVRFLNSDDGMVSSHFFSRGVQRVESKSFSTSYTRRHKKSLFLRRRGGRLQAVFSGRRWRGRPRVYKNCVVIFISVRGVLVILGM
jgi:hypothetical protein